MNEPNPHSFSKLWAEKYDLEMMKDKLAWELLDLEKRRLEFLAGAITTTGGNNATIQPKENDGSHG